MIPFEKEISAEKIAQLKAENPGRTFKILTAEYDGEEFEVACVIPNKTAITRFTHTKAINPDQAGDELVIDCVFYPDPNVLIGEEYYTSIVPISNKLLQLSGLAHESRVKKA